MDRIGRIIKHPLFISHLESNRRAEADRIFCCHDLSHFLDVARIGTILAHEEGLHLDREIIYAAALLHDIGKHEQYERGIPHEQASARISPEILRDCGFDDRETGVIISAVLFHRNDEIAEKRDLRGVLYRADKASRPCFYCRAAGQCNWDHAKKNHTISY